MLDRALTGELRLRNRTPAQALAELGPEEFWRRSKEQAERRMAIIDSMPRAWRLLQHEYGGRVVHAYKRGVSITTVQRELIASRLDLSDLGL